MKKTIIIMIILKVDKKQMKYLKQIIILVKNLALLKMIIIHLQMKKKLKKVFQKVK